MRRCQIFTADYCAARIGRCSGLHEALFYEDLPDSRVLCRLCPHGCTIAEGSRGICGVRENAGGKLASINYGMLTSISSDPVEKKPLRRFMPGTYTYSCGSYGLQPDVPALPELVDRARQAGRDRSAAGRFCPHGKGGRLPIRCLHLQRAHGVSTNGCLPPRGAARHAGLKTIS